jgi:nucleotide-binding universal stress UspA family protein
MSHQTVVVGYDGSGEADRAVEAAVATHTPVSVLIVHDPSTPPPD